MRIQDRLDGRSRPGLADTTPTPHRCTGPQRQLGIHTTSARRPTRCVGRPQAAVATTTAQPTELKNMQATTCSGCGEPLPPPSPRGRPARYHGPACRQRAHRARLRAQAIDQDWAALDEVDVAIADVRRRMAHCRDPRPALARLLTAALGIANVHGVHLSPDPRIYKR